MKAKLILFFIGLFFGLAIGVWPKLPIQQAQAYGAHDDFWNETHFVYRLSKPESGMTCFTVQSTAGSAQGSISTSCVIK